MRWNLLSKLHASLQHKWTLGCMLPGDWDGPNGPIISADSSDSFGRILAFFMILYATFLCLLMLSLQEVHFVYGTQAEVLVLDEVIGSATCCVPASDWMKHENNLQPSSICM